MKRYLVRKASPWNPETGGRMIYSTTSPSGRYFRNLSKLPLFAAGVVHHRLAQGTGDFLLDTFGRPILYKDRSGKMKEMRYPTPYVHTSSFHSDRLVEPNRQYPVEIVLPTSASQRQANGFDKDGQFWNSNYTVAECIPTGKSGITEGSVLNHGDVMNVLRRSWFSALSGAQTTDLNAAMTLIGLDQSVILLLDGVNRLMTAIRYLKKGQLIRAADVLMIPKKNRSNHLFNASNRKSFDATYGGAWLELMFGWKQLISDLQAAWDIYSEEVSLCDVIVTSTGRAAFLVDENGKPNYTVSHRTTSNLWNGTQTSSQGGNIVGSTTFQWRLQDPMKRMLAQLGFTNPLYLLWDALPFSYLVDMLVAPVGSMLSLISSEHGLERVSLSQSLKYNADASHVFHGDGQASFNSGYRQRVGVEEGLVRGVKYYTHHKPELVGPHGPQPIEFGFTDSIQAVVDQSLVSVPGIPQLLTAYSQWAVLKR